jgi:hypothetical protein
MRIAAALLVLAAACSAKSAAPTATDVGSTPPPITLTDGASKQVALADLTSTHAKTVVVFYRGFF